MPDTLDDLILTRKPTREQPLLGLMVLVVEDSRFACEALRLICQSSGARIRRAESLASAARHLAAYRPQVAVIDLGLPDGSGLSLIRQLSGADHRIGAILSTSGDDSLRDQAFDAGADAFLTKPLTSISAFQNAVLTCLDLPIGEAIPDPPLAPDRLALRDDLTHARRILGNADPAERKGYVSDFLNGLAHVSGDADILDIAQRTAAGERGIDARLARCIGGIEAS